MISLSLKEWILAGFAALIVYSFYWLSGIWAPSTPQLSHTEDSYEMPRPKESYYSQFDLSGRPIEKVIVGNRKAKNTTTPDAPVAVEATSPAVRPAMTSPAAVRPAMTRPAAVANKNKKSKVALNVVGGNRKASTPFGNSPPLQSLQTSPSSPPAMNGSFVPQGGPPVDVAPPVADNSNEQKLSSGQWFSLLQNQPTKENTLNFMKAKSLIGTQAYYDITMKLLRDSQLDRQKVALYVLDQDVSVDTYVFLVKLPDDIRKQNNLMLYLNASLKKYQDKTRFAVLARALDSSDPQVVISTQTLIMDLISTKKPVEVVPQGASSVNTLTINDFNILKLGLNRLTKSSDGVIAKNAKDIYSALWQGSLVADISPI